LPGRADWRAKIVSLPAWRGGANVYDLDLARAVVLHRELPRHAHRPARNRRQNRRRRPAGDGLQKPCPDRLDLARSPGHNAGPGRDSYDRYIYIHGTSQPHKLGTPNSHGCVLLSDAEVIELFDAVPEGSLVWVEAPST
jgi:hypothetical protein